MIRKYIQDKYYKGCLSSSKYSGIKDDIDFYKQSNKYSKEKLSNYLKSSLIILTKSLERCLINSPEPHEFSRILIGLFK